MKDYRKETKTCTMCTAEIGEMKKCVKFVRKRRIWILVKHDAPCKFCKVFNNNKECWR